eukprot:2275105-Rhodomonas_salina.1
MAWLSPVVPTHRSRGNRLGPSAEDSACMAASRRTLFSYGGTANTRILDQSACASYRTLARMQS